MKEIALLGKSGFISTYPSGSSASRTPELNPLLPSEVLFRNAELADPVDAEYRRQQSAGFSRRPRRNNLVIEEEEDSANVYCDEQASERDEAAVTLRRARRIVTVAVDNFLLSRAEISWVTGQRLVQRATSSDDLIARLQVKKDAMMAMHERPWQKEGTSEGSYATATWRASAY